MQWKFKYIDKLEPESTSSCLIFGNAIHDGATMIAESRKEGKTAYIDEAVERFCDILQNKSLEDPKWKVTDTELCELKTKGEAMLRALDASWTPHDRVIESKKQFSVDLPNSERRLVGEIDLLVRDENNDLVIVDWKTSATKWARDKADRDLQATLYTYAIQKEDPEVRPLFRYDVITKTKTPNYDPILTQRFNDDFIRAIRMIDIAENMVENEVFYPNETSFSCANCQYAEQCRKWHRKKT